MKAFHGKQEIKDFYLNRVRAHKAADEIIKGKYWQDGKGCAVGCTIHSSRHISYEEELGIPEWIAHLEDGIFEKLPNKLSKEWPEQFLLAVKPGVNLNKIKLPFLIYVLEHASKQFDHEEYPDVAKVMKDTILLLQNPNTTTKEFVAASDAAAWAANASANPAADAAWTAATSAARAARAADAATDAATAAWAARSASATWVADAAWTAATSAARAAVSTAQNVSETTITATYIQFSNELIRLIKQLGEQYGGS